MGPEQLDSEKQDYYSSSPETGLEEDGLAYLKKRNHLTKTLAKQYNTSHVLSLNRL